MRLFPVLVAGFLVSGCASQIMEGYVGKPIEEPILDYGPPANVVDLSSGQRAFQWRMTSSGAIPVTTPSTSTIAGPGGFASVTTQSTTYIPYSEDCVYTLMAQPSGETWVVTGYRKPRLACE